MKFQQILRGFGRSTKNSTAKRTRRRLAVETLDQRLMMHGDCGIGHDQVADDALDLTDRASQFEQVITTDPSLYLGVPALESNPGAAATLVLDFDGNFEAGPWENGRGEYEDIQTPAFDLNGNSGSFSSRERQIIRDAWAAVAEDFAPFNINVTTIEPANPESDMVTRVAIGGHPNDWYTTTSSPSGTSTINSFTNDEPNLGFAFSEVLENVAANRGYDDEEFAIIIANTVSHEAGHGFGLRHQSEYDNGGNLLDTYHEGTADWTPIMGSNLEADRVTWHNGATSSATTFQQDLDVLSSTDNGFGYRPDDHGSSMSTATPLYGSLLFWEPTTVNVTGIVEKMNDIDYFRFETYGGEVNVNLDVAEFAPNLDARLEIWRAGGVTTNLWGSTVYSRAQRIAWSDPADDLGASITTTLSAGTYYIAVKSHGQYGDLGQYTLTGELNLAPQTPDLPLSPLKTESTFTTKTLGTIETMASTDAPAFDTSSPRIPAGAVQPLKNQQAPARSTDIVMSQWGSKTGGSSASLEPLSEVIKDLAMTKMKLRSALTSGLKV